MRKKRALKVPPSREVLNTADPRLVQGIHYFTKNVELQLIGGGIADPHRLRAFVTRKPR